MLPLETKTNVKIGDKTYEINYPNVGEVLEIENLKLLLSGNSYGELVKSSHSTATNLLNVIDGVAYFTVLAPNFKKDFNVEDFTKMDALTTKKIVKAFLTFWKWFKAIDEALNKEDEEETEETEK